MAETDPIEMTGCQWHLERKVESNPKIHATSSVAVVFSEVFSFLKVAEFSTLKQSRFYRIFRPISELNLPSRRHLPGIIPTS